MLLEAEDQTHRRSAMTRRRIVKTFYGTLIGIVAVLMVAPLAAGADGAFPSWDQQINNPNRFKVLEDFAGAAVLDRETGLVWEQSPEGTKSKPTPIQDWFHAHGYCNFLTVGGRNGWRLPTIQELASLVDPTKSRPALPSGHPFSNVRSESYWSATTTARDTEWAWHADFAFSGVFNLLKIARLHVWCVRGGQGVDPQ
jgi:hypothetical protein